MPLSAKIARIDGNGKTVAMVRLTDPKQVIRAGTSVRLTAITMREGRLLSQVDTGEVSLTRDLELYEFTKAAAETLTEHPHVSSTPCRNTPTECRLDLAPKCGADRVIITGAVVA